MRYAPLTDSQWEDIAWLIPLQERGRPRTRDRDILNAILYVLITGCRWDELPKNQFPPKSTVHQRFQVWAKAGFFRRAMSRLRRLLPPPAICHLDASVKAAKKGAKRLEKPGTGLPQKSI